MQSLAIQFRTYFINPFLSCCEGIWKKDADTRTTNIVSKFPLASSFNYVEPALGQVLRRRILIQSDIFFELV